jgi:5'-deoxynucleotidase YfbR-like HD superfamily hydrolase
MTEKVLRFYLVANKLKNVIRNGWSEVDISSDRIESVAEHIYGCMILAIGLDSETNLDLDLLKVFKMIIVKELEKVTLKELTTRDCPTTDEREKQAVETLTRLTDGLVKQSELLSLLSEYNLKNSNESNFVHQLGKIESDIQAKIYDLEGNFDLNKALEDAKHYGEPLSSEIIPRIHNASDGWILYDRRYYTDDSFKELSESIQQLKSL